MNDEEIKGSPWDVFIHLLAVIALYASIAGALTTMFQYVNLVFPDPMDVGIDVRNWIREGVALLVIFFSAYVWAWRSIEIDLAANPGKRRLWIRTCPIYLTLFLAGLFALGDLACLVYYFMGGDLTSRFLLKVTAILAVSGAVFWFYLNALRREPGPLPRATRTFVYSIAAVVGAIVITGFATAGSPARARLARLDVNRIEDLRNIQFQIIRYWQSKAVLPASLDQLRDELSGFSPPHDPENRKPYGYRVTSPTSFELCTDFALTDFDTRRSLPQWLRNDDTVWNHQAGHVCFTRTIDPALYPPHKGAAR